MPQLIDVDTPQSAHTRKGFDGFDYEIVFSDEFNTPGRTFYPGLSYLSWFFTFVIFLSFFPRFHDDSMTTFNIFFPTAPSHPTDAPYGGCPPLPFPEFAALSLLAIFGSIVTCQGRLVGILMSHFAQAQSSHSFF